MCGFIIAVSVDRPIDRERFEIARDSMYHRGPDACGSRFFDNDRVALGHRRLSIIDLTEAGNQPMQLDTLWVVFNGEIYNFPELRIELQKHGHRFKSNSDTEVLLHGYRQWGSRLCEHLEGMFAFAIFDESTGRVYIARDHVGQKPLHYASLNGFFVAASEIKAIRAFFDTRFTVRPESMLDYLVYDYVPDPHTWYQDVASVMPGSFMEFSRSGARMQPVERLYWSYTPPLEPDPISQRDALELIDQEIHRSVSSHMLADVEVGALLSGGVDSGGIVSVAGEHTDSRLRTFSIGFSSKGQDELPLARAVADKYQTLHTEKIVSEVDYQTSVESILDIFDQPFADTSLVPTTAVCALAAEKVKVVLTGDGGDETFGGYNLGKYISPFLNRQLWRDLRFDRRSANELLEFLWDSVCYLTMSEKHWNRRRHYPRFRRSTRRELRIIPSELKKRLEQYEFRWMYPRNTVDGLDAFRQAQWHHIKNILPGKMLTKVDRCAMRHSIETRAPFLSHKLIESMLNLPTAVKNPRTDWYKGLFRAWAADRLPDMVLNAPKRGFGVPTEWDALPKDAKSFGAVNKAVRAGLISSKAWPELRRKKLLLWQILQIEHSLNRGML